VQDVCIEEQNLLYLWNVKVHKRSQKLSKKYLNKLLTLMRQFLSCHCQNYNYGGRLLLQVGND
jgi:hypothetical protein